MSTSPFYFLRIFIVTALLALVSSAFFATPAFADGETPPPPDAGTTETSTEGTVEETPMPTEEAAPADSTTTDGTGETSSSDEVAPTEATADGTSTEPVVSETAPLESSGDASTAESLSSLPEGTELIVLDADGEQVPLASEEAADILATGDPMWCPAGVAPIAGAGGCSPVSSNGSFLGVNGLWAWLIFADPAQAGVIWVADTYVSSSAGDGLVVFNGFDFTNMPNYALTIKGGWTGTSAGIIDQNSPSVFDNGGLNIINWIGNVTISDIVVEAASFNTFFTEAGLSVETNGSISVNRVQSNNNTNTGGGDAYGASLDNTGGTGNVTVTNSSFGGNSANGLFAVSRGSITLKNVMVYDNGNFHYGAYLDNSSSVTPKPVSVTTSTFSNNGDSGLHILSDGIVTLSYVTASLNTIDGVFVDTLGAVTLSGANSFDNNDSNGLNVITNGTIIIANTTANDNNGTGVVLNNAGSPISVGVTISGYLNANNNGVRGLQIDSTGVVTAANLTTTSNGQEGTQIINTLYCPLAVCQAKNVTISGTNFFNDNAYEGLSILSRGVITLYNVTANNNGYTGDYGGVFLNNDYDITKQVAVTLNGYNTFLENSSSGISVESFGAITLNNVTAVHNGFGNDADQYGYGANLKNDGGLYAKSVAVKGINIFSNNEGGGLNVYSDGAIALSKITANNNGDTGVALNNADAPTSVGVTISGYLIANDNPGKGLDIVSTGAVLAANLTTNGNDEEGTQIINTYCPVTGCVAKNVTISGINTFNGNDFEGLVIYSRGTVLLYNVTANDNGFVGDFGGALIDNDATSTVQMAVTLNGVNTFWGNSNTGLSIDSFGVITLNNVTALNNGLGFENGAGSGAYLENIGGLYAKAVGIKGTNVFNGNDGIGLSINSAGAITLSKATADYNGTGGALLVNSWSSTQSNVIISGYGLFNSNGSFGGTGVGLDISSYGAITLANITAQYNYGSGADLYTIGVTVGHAVTLTGTNSFNYNGNDTTSESGLIINADGNITVSNLTASYNSFTGAKLDNFTNWDLPVTNFVGFGSVFVNGFGNFVGNMHDDGLYVKTHGNITLNRVTANDNGDGADDRGLDLYAGWGAISGNITITCSSAYGNEDFGIYASAPGTITVKGLLVYGNALPGEPLSAPTVVRSVCP
jgi:hypothetical protein